MWKNKTCMNKALIIVLLVSAFIGFAFLLFNISITVRPTPLAASSMPSSVKKFEDGEVTCYTYSETVFSFGDNMLVGGISCVK